MHGYVKAVRIGKVKGKSLAFKKIIPIINDVQKEQHI
jgi:hypothetical protein